jgi:UDP-N-acetylglucosamine--N-acetylmuramyl-(pentapeptide) pyrophosphoryl-undecaprenol N-acetylglucosamine transferase
VLTHKAAPYPAIAPFQLLIFGGSQGAQFFGEFMPKVFAAMTPQDRKAMQVTQQVRPENMSQVKALYAELDVNCELQPFFMDMPARIAAAHLVVCRSGASTIAELGVIGRPAIMVPLPHAIDNDQLRNAESFAKAGAGWVHPQAGLEPKGFAAFLTRLASQEGELKRAAAAALGHGKPDAAQRLADLTERLAGNTQQ